jgi:hypothetical protein
MDRRTSGEALACDETLFNCRLHLHIAAQRTRRWDQPRTHLTAFPLQCSKNGEEVKRRETLFGDRLNLFPSNRLAVAQRACR